EVFPGVEGLVHISQISHQHIATPHEVLQEGQEIQVKVLDAKEDEQRLSLSIKALEEKAANGSPADDERKEKKEKSVGEFEEKIGEWPRGKPSEGVFDEESEENEGEKRGEKGSVRKVIFFYEGNGFSEILFHSYNCTVEMS
ncbi:MAG: S1 RNA-binding domain-containing protein, partial [Candidatus Moraniibacteriota bacterium]